MSLFPRLRQACQGSRWGTAAQAGEGSGAKSDALARHSPLAAVASALQDQDSRLAHNRLFLTGVLAADPQEDKGRDGDPVTLLLIAFPAPDARETQERLETASCEVEVPARVSEKHGQELRPGEPIFITGQLSGGGGVIATQLFSGPPPG